MSQPFIRNRYLHAPYFIFVRTTGVYTDVELLHQLGVTQVARDWTPSRTTRSLFVTEDQEWMHVADDWSYTLWHSPSVRIALTNLAMRHDVFTCSVGDSDRSFEFAYYKDTHLLRHYAVDISLSGKRGVVTDIGRPLPGEAEALQREESLEIVLGIAQSLGIDKHNDLQAIRTYTYTDT
jgi:hypothetical protein